MSDYGFGMYAALVIGGIATTVLAFFIIKFLIYSIGFLFKRRK